MRALARAGAATLLALALTAPSSHAATQVHGSPLVSPANGGWGCETAWLPDLYGTHQPMPSQQGSCTYFTPGNSNATSAFVPGAGTITKARVKSGPNPAPLSIVILRRTWLVKNGKAVDHTCCSVQSETAVFQPTPNGITEVPVNLAVSTQPAPEEQQAGWHDIVGVSAHGPGELPIATLGPQNLSVGTQQGILTAIGFYPRITPGTFSINEWNLPNAEILMQYEWTDGCANPRTALRQACGGTPGAAAPQVPGAPGVPTTTAAPELAEVRSSRLSLRGRRVTLTVKCTRGDGKTCSARVRLRKRGKKLVTLASRKVRIKNGTSKKVRLTLSKRARKRVRSSRTKVRVEVDFGKKNGGKVTRNLTLRKRR